MPGVIVKLPPLDGCHNWFPYMNTVSQRFLRRRVPGAFTLVEVLVAIAIFGMAVVVLGSAYVNVLQSYESIRRDQIPEEEVEFVFSRVLSIESREDFEAGGRVETLHAGVFDWDGHLEQTRVAELFEAEVRVRLPGGAGDGRPREVVRTFVLYRPGWEEPAERDRLREETRDRLEERRRLRESRVAGRGGS